MNSALPIAGGSNDSLMQVHRASIMCTLVTKHGCISTATYIHKTIVSGAVKIRTHLWKAVYIL